MSFRHPLVVALSVLLSTAACGGSEEQQKADAVAAEKEKAAKSVAGGLEQTAKGVEQTAKGLESFAEGLLKGVADNVDGKTVDPVSFRELQMVFGDLRGWEKGKPTGQRMTAPIPFSEATVTYRMGDATIEAKVIDSGFHQLLLAPFAVFLTAGYEKETEDGYEKSVKIGGYPGWEKWDASSKDGELHAVVGKRFLVAFEGDGLESTRILYDLAKTTDLAKLATLK